tara:strand:+ start:8713 stop:12330 length:3618 start_codon:yes stop_codon:yes gene_type:complete
MAERERFATRRLQPGNNMRFSPSIPQQQGDTARLNQMEAMANQLLQFSDSFAGAFKAKFQYDDREAERQRKIDEQVKKEFTTEQELLGRTERRRNNLLRPEQRKIILSPEAQRGWMLQDFEIKRDNRNKYLNTHAKTMATSIFNAYNLNVKAGKIKNTTLEKFAANYIELRRSSFIDNDFSYMTQKEGEDPIYTVTREAQEVLDKKGLDFTKVYEEVANLSVQQTETINRSILQRQVQTIVRGTTPPATYKELKRRIFQAQINTDEGAYFTEAQVINEYIRDIKEQLKFAKRSDDPVFSSLDFLDTDDEGVSLSNNGYLTESPRPGVRTVGDDVSALYKTLRDEKIKLETKEFNESKDYLLKQKEERQKKASDNSRKFISLISGAENLHALKIIRTQWDGTRNLYEDNTTNDTQFGWGKLDKLFAEKEKAFVGNEFSTTLKGTEDAPKFQQLLSELGEYQTDQKKFESLNTDKLTELQNGFVPYYKYTEVEKAQKILSKLREQVEEREKNLEDEEKRKEQEQYDDEVLETVEELTDQVRALEQNANRTPKDSAQLQKRILEELAKYSPTDETKTLKDRLSKLITLDNKADKTEIYEQSGLDAITGAKNVLSAVQQGDKNVTLEIVDKAITALNNNNTILYKDRKTAISTLFDARAALQEKSGDKELINLRKELSGITEDADKLQKFINSDKYVNHPDVGKEAQAHLNNLNNRAANQKFYWETYNKRVKDSDARLKERIAREDIRREEERAFRKGLKEEERAYQKKLKKENREYNEAEKRKFWAEKQKDIRAHQLEMYEKRKKDAAELRKKYKLEEQEETSEKLKKARLAGDKANDLMTRFIEAGTDEAKKAKIVKEFSSDAVQRIFSQSPNNAAYDAVNNFLLDQKAEKTKNDRSIANRKISDQSKERRNTDAGALAGKIDVILESENPDFDEARRLLMGRTVIQEYYSDDGRIEPISVDTLPLSKRIEYSSKIRARRLQKLDKDNGIEESTTNINSHIKLENKLRDFPFELAENDTTGKSLEEKQAGFIAQFWTELTNAYASRDISQTTFNQLDNDLKKIQKDAGEREWFMAKTAPFSPIKTWERSLTDKVANPGGFFLEFRGAGNFFQAEENRKQLVADMRSDYQTIVNDYFRRNPEWIKDIDAQQLKCKEIHDFILDKYQPRIQKVNDILNINQDPTNANLEVEDASKEARQAAALKKLLEE